MGGCGATAFAAMSPSASRRNVDADDADIFAAPPSPAPFQDAASMKNAQHDSDDIFAAPLGTEPDRRDETVPGRCVADLPPAMSSRAVPDTSSPNPLGQPSR